MKSEELNFHEAVRLLNEGKCLQRTDWQGYIRLLGGSLVYEGFGDSSRTPAKSYRFSWGDIQATDWMIS